MKIIKSLGLLIGIGTIFNLSIVKPMYGQELNPSLSHKPINSSTILDSSHQDKNLVIAQNHRPNRGLNSQHPTSRYSYPNRRPETIIIIVPSSNDRIDFFNGNLRRNSNYWRNNNINQNNSYYPSRSIESRRVNNININSVNFNNSGFRRVETKCVHRQFQTVWANVHCNMNHPSFKWRNIYVD
ncbi:hypothetical protein AA637_14765 [Cyanobacterium sp. HL-69]|uniref:hypothetical protein n=1 Tax=Cyanobacterium sp. HL-69 TaxID=2054282 RepID=UPI000CA30DAB|nr:hypothetical protein AA637_14765 [Cyanobacterium sp. HL-69]